MKTTVLLLFTRLAVLATAALFFTPARAQIVYTEAHFTLSPGYNTYLDMGDGFGGTGQLGFLSATDRDFLLHFRNLMAWYPAIDALPGMGGKTASHVGSTYDLGDVDFASRFGPGDQIGPSSTFTSATALQ